jgi:hypothetical protein
MGRRGDRPGALIALLAGGRGERVVGLVGYAVVAGFLSAVVMQTLLGVVTGP